MSGGFASAQFPPTSRVTDRVLIVDDHDLLASALARALRPRGLTVETVAGPTLGDIAEAARRLAPVAVLLDLDLGPVGSGADLVVPLIEAGARVSVFSGTLDRARVALCLERGAVGVVLKTAPLETLIDHVESLASGQDVMSEQQRAMWRSELAARRDRLAPFDRLTAREQAVLRMLMAGQPAEQVADKLFISLPTVRSHIRSVLQKLEVRSQLAAVALAFELGWPEG